MANVIIALAEGVIEMKINQIRGTTPSLNNNCTIFIDKCTP